MPIQGIGPWPETASRPAPAVCPCGQRAHLQVELAGRSGSVPRIQPCQAAGKTSSTDRPATTSQHASSTCRSERCSRHRKTTEKYDAAGPATRARNLHWTAWKNPPMVTVVDLLSCLGFRCDTGGE